MCETENVYFFKWSYAEEEAELTACKIWMISFWIITFKMLYHNIFRVLDTRLSFLLHVKACVVAHLFSLLRKLVSNFLSLASFSPCSCTVIVRLRKASITEMSYVHKKSLWTESAKSEYDIYVPRITRFKTRSCLHQGPYSPSELGLQGIQTAAPHWGFWPLPMKVSDHTSWSLSG